MNLRSDHMTKSKTGNAVSSPAETKKLQFKIGGMACSFCVASITKALGRMNGICDVNVNLALSTMFGPGWHILTMAWASLRRGILNQHVLLEFGAFAGLTGGFLGYVYSAFPVPDFDPDADYGY